MLQVAWTENKWNNFYIRIEKVDSENLQQPKICIPSEQLTIEPIQKVKPENDVKLQEMIDEIKIDENIKDQFASIEVIFDCRFWYTFYDLEGLDRQEDQQSEEMAWYKWSTKTFPNWSPKS